MVERVNVPSPLVSFSVRPERRTNVHFTGIIHVTVKVDASPAIGLPPRRGRGPERDQRQEPYHDFVVACCGRARSESPGRAERTAFGGDVNHRTGCERQTDEFEFPVRAGASGFCAEHEVQVSARRPERPRRDGPRCQPRGARFPGRVRA